MLLTFLLMMYWPNVDVLVVRGSLSLVGCKIGRKYRIWHQKIVHYWGLVTYIKRVWELS